MPDTLALMAIIVCLRFACYITALFNTREGRRNIKRGQSQRDSGSSKSSIDDTQGTPMDTLTRPNSMVSLTKSKRMTSSRNNGYRGKLANSLTRSGSMISLGSVKDFDFNINESDRESVGDQNTLTRTSSMVSLTERMKSSRNNGSRGKLANSLTRSGSMISLGSLKDFDFYINDSDHASVDDQDEWELKSRVGSCTVAVPFGLDETGVGGKNNSHGNESNENAKTKDSRSGVPQSIQLKKSMTRRASIERMLGSVCEEDEGGVGLNIEDSICSSIRRSL